MFFLLNYWVVKGLNLEWLVDRAMGFWVQGVWSIVARLHWFMQVLWQWTHSPRSCFAQTHARCSRVQHICYVSSYLPLWFLDRSARLQISALRCTVMLLSHTLGSTLPMSSLSFLPPTPRFSLHFCFYSLSHHLFLPLLYLRAQQYACILHPRMLVVPPSPLSLSLSDSLLPHLHLYAVALVPQEALLAGS